MNASRPFRLGILVNPFAGIGGALALKGSDGTKIREQALAQGAKKQANEKMAKALSALLPLQQPYHILTAGGEMGQSVCNELALAHEVVYTSELAQTEDKDTEQAARAMLSADIDLLLFAGGDGTARNLCTVIQQTIPVLGVPAGCKIHSGVYAITPSAAGEVVAQIIQGQLVSETEAEVRDIDEDAFRQGKVLSRYYGEMRVPEALHYVQAVKSGGRESDELVLHDIAAHIIEVMDEEPDTCFVMGSGSTVAAVMHELNLDNTLLGVDVVKNKSLIARDVTAGELLSVTAEQETKLVITAIGGQGHIFGRGNQQLSPALLRRIGKANILIVATKQKLQDLSGKPLRLDTSDSELDAALAGPVQIITGYHDKVLYQAQ